MPTPATNVSVYSLNSLTGIEIDKQLILSERPTVNGTGVALLSEIGGGIIFAPEIILISTGNNTYYRVQVNDSGALVTSLYT
jgi:hypothetical protein